MFWSNSFNLLRKINYWKRTTKIIMCERKTMPLFDFLKKAKNHQIVCGRRTMPAFDFQKKKAKRICHTLRVIR
jgi:nicotinate-nucleotide pyrophosphorylase